MAALVELWQKRSVLCIFSSRNGRFSNDVREYFDVFFNYSEIALEALNFLACHNFYSLKGMTREKDELTLI